MKITFARYRHPQIYGNGFMGAASVDCHLGPSTNPVCHTNGVATYVSTITNSPALAGRPSKKAIPFAKGSLTVPYGKTLPLKLKITAAGKKLLRPGRSLKLALTIEETAPGAEPQTSSKVVTVKVPKR